MKINLSYDKAMVVYVLLIDKQGEEGLTEEESALLMEVHGFLDQESIK